MMKSCKHCNGTGKVYETPYATFEAFLADLNRIHPIPEKDVEWWRNNFYKDSRHGK